LWGKLAAEILVGHWDMALEEIQRLRETIDQKVNRFGVVYSVVLTAILELHISSSPITTTHMAYSLVTFCFLQPR
jgi:hypothetical protein